MADDPKKKKPKHRHVHVKISDQMMGGVYSNHMVVAHTREEFILDFLVMLPNSGTLVSRVIVSPGHMKRIVKALTENVARYQRKHGAIDDSPEPPATPPAPVPSSIN